MVYVLKVPYTLREDLRGNIVHIYGLIGDQNLKNGQCYLHCSDDKYDTLQEIFPLDSPVSLLLSFSIIFNCIHIFNTQQISHHLCSYQCNCKKIEAKISAIRYNDSHHKFISRNYSDIYVEITIAMMLLSQRKKRWTVE